MLGWLCWDGGGVEWDRTPSRGGRRSGGKGCGNNADRQREDGLLGVIGPLLQTPHLWRLRERGLIGARGGFSRVFLSFCSAFCLLASRTFLGGCEVRRGESRRESSASLPRL